MRRLALVGTALGIPWATTAPRTALAGPTKAEKALFGGGDSGLTEAEEPPPAAPVAAQRKQRRAKPGGKRGRHGVSGRVVSEDSLRQGPLPTPSGKLHVMSVNTGD